MARVAMCLLRAAIMAVFVVSFLCYGSAEAQSPLDEAAALDNRVVELYNAGKAGEAIPLAKRAHEMREKALPADHPRIALGLNSLAALYLIEGRLTEADSLMTRVLEMLGKATQEPLHVAAIASNLGALHRAQGRLTDAEQALKLALEMYEQALSPDDPEIGGGLNDLAGLYRVQGRPAEAEPLYKRALAIREKTLPAGHRDIAQSLHNLAVLYWTQDRLAEAEPLYKRAFSIREKALPPDHPLIDESINSLVLVLEKQGRLAEAEPYLKGVLQMREKALPAGHPDIALSLRNLAAFYRAQNRLAEAELLHKRALAIREKAFPDGHPDVGQSLSELAGLYFAQGRFAEVEPLHKRALAIREKVLPAGHPDIALSLSNLAVLYWVQGRLTEAEPLYKRALAIREKALPPNHPDIAKSLDGLARLFQTQGRLPEAEPLLKAVLEMREKALPAGHPDIVDSLNNLALIYMAQGRLTEAEPLYKRALEISEKEISEKNRLPKIATTLNDLASLYRQQRRFSEAESLMKRALDIYLRELPSDHAIMSQGLNNLALIYMAQGRLTEAEPLYKRALEIQENALPDSSPRILDNLAELFIDKGAWGEAVDYARRASARVSTRAKRAAGPGGATGATWTVLSDGARSFHLLMLAAFALGEQHPEQRAALRDETFIVAQWAGQTAAGVALAQMAARLARGEGALAGIVREQQDLLALWQRLDKAVVAARSAPPENRDAAAEAVQAQHLAETDRMLVALNARLARDFPEYAGLSNPEPLSVRATQAQLRPYEALVQFAFAGVESFAWVVTKTDARWMKLALAPNVVAAQVEALRCGLDVSAWRDAGLQTCREYTMAEPLFDRGGNARLTTLPFDLARAYDLYRGLLAPFEDLIKDKHLIVVPSGALTTLPFNVLVTEQPKLGAAGRLADYRDAKWLGRRQPITVLPSVAALQALRRFVKTSRATKLLLGIGNPLLDGPDESYAKPAAKARATDSCSKTGAYGMAGAVARSRIEFPSLFSATNADIEKVRQWAPLPDTADELCQVAQRLGVPESEILLGARTTETALKQMSEKGRLADYAILHFATHGALAGQVNGSAEPGLILTPPAKGTVDPQSLDRDDGYLTASEIATLKLDADWVVLSACNTAGSSGETAEALSGLARAFFYAGARALLVSHWEVDSAAAVKLITKAFAELKADPGIGRAEALRRSMVALMTDASEVGGTHPSAWAPFVVVGEGGK